MIKHAGRQGGKEREMEVGREGGRNGGGVKAGRKEGRQEGRKEHRTNEGTTADGLLWAVVRAAPNRLIKVFANEQGQLMDPIEQSVVVHRFA